MDSYRKTAIIVGVLFITATVTALLSIVSLGSTLDDPGYLTDVSANENQVITAVILWLILAVSVMGIGVMMFPILKKDNESLALGYVGFRLIETILIIVASLSLLSLLTLSQEYVAGTLDASYYQPLGTSLLALQNWSFGIGTMIFLGLGGLPLYYLLYQSRLVPRWLSVWGIIGAALILLYGLVSLFGPDPGFLAMPIFAQEMVFAAWLIVKGFNPSAIAS
ncbi:MAG: DUF4386 domain-containing protein [Candidatus Thermoplasmatota archaeon]|nr:DUF4386 domain-containing protein [Candidatus Thermoplasmatota archaeon]